MGTLLNVWIQLFDEKNFSTIDAEPDALKPLLMLFRTIQQEFKKIESCFEEKISTVKSLNKNNLALTVNSEVKNDSLELNNPVVGVSDNVQLPKSPTFEKHRKRVRKSKSPLQSSENRLNEKSTQSDDDEVLDCSLINATPLSKHSRLGGSLKKSKNSSANFSKLFSYSSSKKMKCKVLAHSTQKQEADTESYFEDNLPGFVNDYDKLPEINNETPGHAKKQVLRGKERKKLQGWSCKDCEKFYEGLNLNPEELERKMNECSKHRSKFKPDETFAGFWDLSIPLKRVKSAEVTDTSESSIDKSTIYF